MKKYWCRYCKKRKFKESADNISIAIDYDRLAQAIVKANEIATEKQIEKEEEAERKNQEEWKKSNWLSATTQPLKTFQIIWWVLRLPFVRKKKITDNRATKVLTKMVVINILRLFQISFALLGILSVVGLLNRFDFPHWTVNNLFFASTLFLSWVFCGIIRMSVIEIDKMRDQQMLLSVLSAITSFVAMIVAIVALFV